MDANRMLQRSLRWLGLGSLLVATVVTVAGCEEPSAKAEPPAPASPAPTDKAEAPPVEAPAPEVKGQSSYKEEAFHLSIQAPSSVKAGQTVELKVVLEAQAGFKVNQEYPLKFQFTDAAGVTPAKKTVRKGDAKVEKKRAEIPLPVKLKAGKHKVSGKLSFSVCTDERCLIEKRDLSLDVNAS